MPARLTAEERSKVKTEADRFAKIIKRTGVSITTIGKQAGVDVPKLQRFLRGDGSMPPKAELSRVTDAINNFSTPAPATAAAGATVAEIIRDAKVALGKALGIPAAEIKISISV